MPESPKKIVFILPGYGRYPVGGLKIAYQYANMLSSLGAKVTLCALCSPDSRHYHLPKFLHRGVCIAFTRIFPRWYRLDRDIEKRCIFSIDDCSVPRGTDIVASAAITANPVYRLSPELGRKHYLIQGYELWDMPEAEVLDTYRLGMSNIVVSDWLKKIVWDASGDEPTLIKNPIDRTVFFPEEGIDRQWNEVACLYHEAEHKGFADLFKALNIAKQAVPELVVNAFGAPERPEWFPEWIHYTWSANQDQLRSIYSRSSIFVCASVNEGFGLTLPESMFCGCALVSTRFRGVWEYANENCAMLSDVHDPDALARNLIILLRDSCRARELAERGRRHAMNECSVDKTMNVLRKEFSI